jgi:1-acyl-sn-glycerol-3-phosphate acyltransferase
MSHDAPQSTPPSEPQKLQRPGLRFPEFKLPEVKLPELKLPEIKLPVLKLPRQRGMSFGYWTARTVCGLFICIFFKFRIVGVKNVPQRGAYMLVANHTSYFDPPIVSGMTPTPLHFFARKSLLKNKWFWVLHKALNIIPVDTEGKDGSAIRVAVKILKDDKPLVIFPEGTRSHDGNLQRAQPGAGFIGCLTQVPVLPVRIFGAYEALDRTTTKPKWGKPITVVIGPLLHPADYDVGKGDPERYQKASDRFMAAIAGLEKPSAHTESEIEWTF